MTQPSPYFIRRTSLPEDSDPADNRVNFFDDDEGRIDFNQYWRTIRKHLSMIVAIFVAVTLLTLIKLLMETPMYTAAATILIKPGTPQIFVVEEIDAIVGWIRVLGLRGAANKIWRRLGHRLFSFRTRRSAAARG